MLRQTPYVIEMVAKTNLPTSSLFIEIVAMRNPFKSSLFIVTCCQKYNRSCFLCPDGVAKWRQGPKVTLSHNRPFWFYSHSTWRIQKVLTFKKIFCTCDNQFFIKCCLLTFSTMEILNPKVGTVPRKFEKYLWLTNRLAQFLP